LDSFRCDSFRRDSFRRDRSGTINSMPLPPDPSARPFLKVAQVLTLELSQPIAPLYVPDAESVRIYIQWCDRLLGYVTIHHGGKPIGIDRIADAIMDQRLAEIIAIPFPDRPNLRWQASEQAIAQYFAPAAKPSQTIKTPTPLPKAVSVSIIVPTCDRPDDLRHCLEHLQRVKTDRSIEIIVADNRPQNGNAAQVLKDFPGVKLVEESRVGSAYARNAAIVASSGDIVITVDDDVTVPSDWLEKLIVPFNRPDVMAVFGGVLPFVLDTPAQMLFEDIKGGLCFGFEKREVDKAWLDSFDHGVPPIWELGVSANAAFRSTIFAHPTIGLMEETLGPGTPTSGAEENHYSYKILRSGGTIVYEPSAYVWHHHRRTLPAFYKQLQGQMVSCAPLHLTIWLQEGDRRGRQQLLVHMPRYFLECWRDRLFHRSKTPWRILFFELKGYAIGFWAYGESKRLVKQQGRSDRYVRQVDRT
jgi:O-antigen biosynthesis protein